jgi:hypothetical protein
MVAVTLATCATYASAQTPGGMPAQSQPIAAQQNRSDTQLVRDVRRAFTRATGLNSAAIHVNARDADRYGAAAFTDRTGRQCRALGPRRQVGVEPVDRANEAPRRSLSHAKRHRPNGIGVASCLPSAVR